MSSYIIETCGHRIYDVDEEGYPLGIDNIISIAKVHLSHCTEAAREGWQLSDDIYIDFIED